jgi:transitional endoplasmic reticulum ATPase
VAQTLQRTIPAADVVRQGEKIILPDLMSTDDAMAVLILHKKYEEEEVRIVETFDAFPYDGACAFDNVLTRTYGFAPAVARETFFGPQPPQLISVEVGYNEFRQVPWGDIQVPGVSGKLTTTATTKDGRWLFVIVAQVKRTHEGTIKELYEKVRREIKENSIYRGKAVKIRFLDDDGDPVPLPTPKFMDTESIRPEMLVFPDTVMRAIQTSLFTPISRPQDCLANGIPLKRGILLGGDYGTGKTLAAAVASKLAVQAGVTFLYAQRADELPHAVEFCRQYQSPAGVVFCEDIDRALDGERDAEMDNLLNTIDGIDSKSANIIVVLTTNRMENIHPAMLRPGRLDAVINVTAPDAHAAEKLVRLYAGSSLLASEDLSEVGRKLAGTIPAVIAEVVRRAKLSQLALEKPGALVSKITAEALLDATETMRMQIMLLNRDKNPEVKDTLRDALNDAVGNSRVVVQLKERVEEVHRAVNGG